MQKCLTRLLAGFPSSPRVAALRGAILEASAPDAALKFYADVLELDSGDAVRTSFPLTIMPKLTFC